MEVAEDYVSDMMATFTKLNISTKQSEDKAIFNFHQDNEESPSPVFSDTMKETEEVQIAVSPPTVISPKDVE
jgi:hypothetical protein